MCEVKNEDLRSLVAGAYTHYWASNQTLHSVTERETGRVFPINERTLIRAMRRMSKVAPHAFAEIMQEGAGANSTVGDILVQLCCFDEVKYG